MLNFLLKIEMMELKERKLKLSLITNMNKKKILIIDDEVDIANNIRLILSDENYNTSIAHNSKDALQQLSEIIII